MGEGLPVQKPRWLSKTSGASSRIGISILTALLPSFLIPLFGLPVPKGLHGSPGKIATLDGLRGLSCWAVFNHHYCDIITDGYAFDVLPAVSNQLYLSHYPMIAIIWQGTSQVYVFFVLSGYVLSARLIKMIHQRQWSGFHKTVTSAVFRRAPRMFLPAIASIIIYSILIQMGGFNKAREIYTSQYVNKSMQIKMGEPMPPMANSVWDQAVNAWYATLTMLDPSGDIFSIQTYMWYSGHLWTIPVEFYTSIAMFIVMLGSSRLRPVWRLLSTMFLASWCWWAFHLHLFLFLCGMTIAELDILWENRQKAHRDDTSVPLRHIRQSSSSSNRGFRTYFKDISYLSFVRASMLLMGIWLLSMPKHGGELTPGFMIFFKMVPGKRTTIDAHDAIRAIGAVLTVWPISNVSIMEKNPNEDSSLQKWWERLSFRGCVEAVLANPVSIYAGRISFGFYLLHGLFVKSLGYTLIPTFYRSVVVTPRVNANIPMTDPLTKGQVAALTILGYICIFPVLVWASDLFTRHIDDRCIAFARALERFMEVREEVVTAPVMPSPEEFEMDKEMHVNGYASVRQDEQV